MSQSERRLAATMYTDIIGYDECKLSACTHG